MEPMFPEAVTPIAGFGLILLSFFTSMLAAAVGLGGGVIMLAALANLLPATAVIAVHAVIQIGSNAGRVAIMMGDVDRRVAGFVIAGSLVGAILGGFAFTQIPGNWLLLAIGLFILQSVWLPLPKMAGLGVAGLITGGAVSSFLTIFLGATGPFLAAFARPIIKVKETYVATHAAMMTVQHGLKIVVFGILGFAFQPWLPFLALMILSGFLGTLVGRRILFRMPERVFSSALKAVLTIAALRLIWDAF